MRVHNGVGTHFTTKEGLAANDTKVIIEDGQGGLWLGSYGGLTHYRDGKFTAWKEKDGLPGATVRALNSTATARCRLAPMTAVWRASRTGASPVIGLQAACLTMASSNPGKRFRLVLDELQSRHLPCAQTGIAADFADGGTKTLTCLAYNQNDGMPSSECNGGRWPAGVKTRDGKLCFPTMGGVAIIDPSTIKTNTQPPPVMLEELASNNQPVELERWQSAIHNSQSAISIFRAGQFRDRVYGAQLINSENLRFKYKLEGADTDWVDAGTRRTAYFRTSRRATTPFV